MACSPLRRLMTLLVAPCAVVVGACGSGEAVDQGEQEGRRGGTLTVLAKDDVDFIDPGLSYYQFSYLLQYALHRPLLSYRPGRTTPSPDLATEMPRISRDGRQITVAIRRGVRFSPPVDREVTAADVKYAIERGFTKSVPNGYASAYFGDIEGVRAFQEGDARDIAGIATPDRHTLAIRLTRPVAGTVVGAMALPLTAPVPEGYARELDKENPSTYGERVAFTGPYMIENDAQGKLTGYEPGRRIRIVRNPNWNDSTDYRPAYLDAIDVREGNSDTTAASRRILTGRSMVNGDFPPPPAVLRRAVGESPDQLELVPSGGIRYISLNTTVEPFDDANVRRAVVAVFDREALRLTRGGQTVGDVPTHFIPPGIPGFEQSGGARGLGLDFLANPRGDARLAGEYMRRAGYQGGRYDGDGPILMVGVRGGAAQREAEIARAQLEKLGFEVDLRLTTEDTMYTRFCNVPDADVAVCPNVGWAKDFQDPVTILKPTFSGEEIQETNNVNWPELEVPAISEGIERAELISEPGRRAQAFAQVNRLIAEQAPAVPWLWDRQPNIRSANVRSAIDRGNATWDLSFTSVR